MLSSHLPSSHVPIYIRLFLQVLILLLLYSFPTHPHHYPYPYPMPNACKLHVESKFREPFLSLAFAICNFKILVIFNFDLFMYFSIKNCLLIQSLIWSVYEHRQRFCGLALAALSSTVHPIHLGKITPQLILLYRTKLYTNYKKL